MASWTNSTTETVLVLMKTDLGILTSTAYDTRFTQIINASLQSIAREGVTLTDSVEDMQLCAMYAEWTWRKRDTGEGMPRMLRWALNNRILSEKARVTDGNDS